MRSHVIALTDTNAAVLRFMDMESGRLFRPPFRLEVNDGKAPFIKLTKALKKWIAANKIDAVVHVRKDSWSMMGLQMRNGILPGPVEGRSVTLDEIRDLYKKKYPPGQVSGYVPFSFRSSGYRAGWFWFCTRQGTLGVLTYDKAPAGRSGLLLTVRTARSVTRPGRAAAKPDAITQLKLREAELAVKLGVARRDFGPGHRKIMALEIELESVRAVRKRMAREPSAESDVMKQLQLREAELAVKLGIARQKGGANHRTVRALEIELESVRAVRKRMARGESRVGPPATQPAGAEDAGKPWTGVPVARESLPIGKTVTRMLRMRSSVLGRTFALDLESGQGELIEPGKAGKLYCTRAAGKAKTAVLLPTGAGLFRLPIGRDTRPLWAARTAKQALDLATEPYEKFSHPEQTAPYVFAFATDAGAVGVVKVEAVSEHHIVLQLKLLERRMDPQFAAQLRLLGELRRNEGELLASLDQARAKFGPTHPTVKRLDIRFHRLRAARDAVTAKLIERLGGGTHKEREAAQRGLVDIRMPAVAALQKAASDKDPERANRARTALAQIEDRAWGKSSDGVQVRLRALHSVWTVGKTPTLSLDIRNRGKAQIRLFPAAGPHCQIELDGQWYTPRGPIVITGPGWPLEPGRDRLKAIPVELTDSWALLEGKTIRAAKPLRLSPGKHTLRVRFRPLGGKPICASNAVQILIEPAATPPAPNRASTRPVAPG